MVESEAVGKSNWGAHLILNFRHLWQREELWKTFVNIGVSISRTCASYYID
jgi:predicted aconitase